MTGEEMERAIEFLLQSQTKTEAQLAQASRQVEATAAALAEFKDFTQSNIEALNEDSRSIPETVRSLPTGQKHVMMPGDNHTVVTIYNFASTHDITVFAEPIGETLADPTSVQIPYGSVEALGFWNSRDPEASCNIVVSNPGGRDGRILVNNTFGVSVNTSVVQNGSGVMLYIKGSTWFPYSEVDMNAFMIGDLLPENLGRTKDKITKLMRARLGS